MSIGVNLRKLRNVKQMTLKRVAEGSGISVALLSQVERGRVDPSVNTLRKLAEFLGVSVGYFFGGITYHLLSTKTAPNLEVIFNSFEVGATTGVGLYSHPGEECGVVLEGALQVELSDRIFILEQGDSISFSSSIPHRLSNAGITPAKAIWVNTPAEF